MTENGQIEWLPKQISFALNKVRGNLETFKELVPPAASLNQIYYPEEILIGRPAFGQECYFSKGINKFNRVR